jgi:hypothetical protein
MRDAAIFSRYLPRARKEASRWFDPKAVMHESCAGVIAALCVEVAAERDERAVRSCQQYGGDISMKIEAMIRATQQP